MGKMPKGGGAAGVAMALAALAVEKVGPVIVDKIADRQPSNKIDISDDRAVMPDICSKKFPLMLSEATTLLENRGLKVLPIEVRLKDADPKYKDCLDSQVIASDHKPGEKLKPGDTIIVQYITQEVIDKSRLIYEQTEQVKLEKKQAEADKRAKQIAQLKAGAAKNLHKAADTIGAGAVAARDGLKKFVKRDNEKELGKGENQ